VSWLDALSAEGKAKAGEKRRERLKPIPIIIQVRGPDEDTGDPGQIEEAFYAIDNGNVVLVNHNGEPEGGAHEIPEGHQPYHVAARLLRERWENRSGGDFNRRLGRYWIKRV
jgi:hypothetical protein